jgi:hypothetical protein
MEKKMMIADTLWKELEQESQRINDNGMLKRMLAPNANCTMFLAVQRPFFKRTFLLQVSRKQLPSRQLIPESRGFELAVRITGEEAETHATFILSATNPIYNEVFSAMVDNLYQNLKECKEEQQIVRLFLECLIKWQRFFEMNSSGLSEISQRGLYGELYFLKNHLLSSPDFFIDDISAWTGSKARQHDFQFGNTVVEIKTCCAKQHQTLLISNEQQLDETLVDNLFLFHLSLSSVENQTNTLPSLILQIRETLFSNYAATSIFEDALLERGYLNTQAWRYQKTGYVIRETNLFRVSGNFPRLTERNLPIGVGCLTYSINVAECKKFSVKFDELFSHIRKRKT